MSKIKVRNVNLSNEAVMIATELDMFARDFDPSGYEEENTVNRWSGVFNIAKDIQEHNVDKYTEMLEEIIAFTDYSEDAETAKELLELIKEVVKEEPEEQCA